MYLHFFGIPMNFTVGNVALATFLTFLIYLLHQFFLDLRKFSPFKKDKLANESLFFIYMIRKDYFQNYQGIVVAHQEEFAKKLWQISMVFNLEQMQNEAYRIQFQNILKRHHDNLEDVYELFYALQYLPIFRRADLEMVVNRTHTVLNLLIVDINEEFKDKDWFIQPSN